MNIENNPVKDLFSASRPALIILFFLLFIKSANAQDSEKLAFRPLFNGKNLNGWIDVNTSKETWKVKNGTLICSGLPIGVMRSDKQYENFILEVEWKHMTAGGNSGIFVWSEGTQFKDDPLTKPSKYKCSNSIMQNSTKPRMTTFTANYFQRWA